MDMEPLARVQYQIGYIDRTETAGFYGDIWVDVPADGIIRISNSTVIKVRALAVGNGTVRQVATCADSYIHAQVLGHQNKFSCVKDRGHSGKHFGRNGGRSAEWE